MMDDSANMTRAVVCFENGRGLAHCAPLNRLWSFHSVANTLKTIGHGQWRGLSSDVLTLYLAFTEVHGVGDSMRWGEKSASGERRAVLWVSSSEGRAVKVREINHGDRVFVHQMPVTVLLLKIKFKKIISARCSLWTNTHQSLCN